VKDVGIVLMTMIRRVIVLNSKKERNEMRNYPAKKNVNQSTIPLLVEIDITIRPKIIC
jgi:hypothetical protein